ncbi:MAG: beta-lactamase family protein [FCB group bacterium]|nr:beta-lactamase family protein [FCB group bacterium]
MRTYRFYPIVAIILLTLMSVTVSAQTAVDIPNTHAGKQLDKFIQALNSGEEESWKAYVLQEQKALDSIEVLTRRLDFFRQIFDDLGGMEIHKIVKSSEYSITALVKGINPSGPFEWVEFALHYDDQPPYGWASIGMQPAHDPNEVLPEGELTKEMLTDFLDNYIDTLVAQDKFSGAVLVAKNGRPIYKRADGEACKRYGIPNKTDTKFNLGSMNKMFTGVAIGQLAQKGKLAFDDYVGKYLPDYPNQAVRDKVTIHQLLTHTSGMGSYWEELFEAQWWEIKTVQQLADLTAEKPLDFEPGERFQYSNAGPIILGLIIEKISGLSYDEYIRQNVTGPAGMINTDCYEVDRPVPNLAIGYTKSDYEGNSTDIWRNNLFMHAAKGGPAGGGYSTVEDLLHFDLALHSDLLLDKEHFDIVTTGKVDMSPKHRYAYLFGDENRNGHRIIGHNGGAPGINAVLSIYLDLGYTVAVMSNYDHAAGLIANKIDRLIIGQ